MDVPAEHQQAQSDTRPKERRSSQNILANRRINSRAAVEKLVERVAGGCREADPQNPDGADQQVCDTPDFNSVAAGQAGPGALRLHPRVATIATERERRADR